MPPVELRITSLTSGDKDDSLIKQVKKIELICGDIVCCRERGGSSVIWAVEDIKDGTHAAHMTQRMLVNAELHDDANHNGRGQETRVIIYTS